MSERPNQPGHLPGQEKIIKTYDEQRRCWYRQIWRQYGWHGQTGALYDLGEDPSQTEKGSFAPLWELVDNEPISSDNKWHVFDKKDSHTWPSEEGSADNWYWVWLSSGNAPSISTDRWFADSLGGWETLDDKYVKFWMPIEVPEPPQ